MSPSHYKSLFFAVLKTDTVPLICHLLALLGNCLQDHNYRECFSLENYKKKEKHTQKQTKPKKERKKKERKKEKKFTSNQIPETGIIPEKHVLK